jgi:uncharacterized protein (UPF0276 family)
MSVTIAGFGLGLRTAHYAEILAEGSIAGERVDWFEAITENYLAAGGQPLYFLDQIRERWPIALHGVSLSIGSVDPLDLDYLADVKRLAQRIDPLCISDHLCWTAVGGVNSHDLLPMPFTPQAVDHIVPRIREVQARLERRILLENVSSYFQFVQGSMAEWQFVATIAEEADCHLLLDVNNLYVNSVNHAFDPYAYMDALTIERVAQLHVAGHSKNDALLIDTHDMPVPGAVWDLYAYAAARFPHAATLLERDDNIPALDELVDELDRARRLGRPPTREAYDAR